MSGAFVFGWNNISNTWRKLLGVNNGGAATYEAVLGVIGHRPPGSAQVALGWYKHNGTYILYTVPAGNTLYLTSWAGSVRNQGLATGVGYVAVRNAVPVIQYYLFSASCAVGNTHLNSLYYSPPLEIPEGWDIVLVSDTNGLYTNFHIHGYVM